MTNMHEIGTEVQQILDPNAADSLAILVGLAVNSAYETQRQFNAAVDGTGNEHAQTIRAHLGEVAQRLGEIMTVLGDIENAKNNLLATWGVHGGASAVVDAPLSGEQGGDTLKVESSSNHLKPATQVRLNRSLAAAFNGMDLDNGPPKALATRIVHEIGADGVQTVGDALLVGRDRLLTFENMGSVKANFLMRALRHAYPGVVWPDTADPALAARLRPSLREVPWACLVDHPQSLGAGTRNARARSVHDILTTPRERLFGGKLSEDEYEHLQARAQEYATQFEAAKQDLCKDQ